MKIVRDNIEIELSGYELAQAHRECKRNYLIEDIKSAAIQEGRNIKECDIERIADIAQSGVDNCDSLWECYWLCITDALEC